MGSRTQSEDRKVPGHYGEKWASKSGVTVAAIDRTSKSSTDTEPYSNHPAPIQPTRRTRLGRFGPCAGVLFMIILVLIALPVVAVSLVWFQENLAYRAKLVQEGGAPQFATAASGVLRIGIILCSGICTAIIASLVLQDQLDGVPFGALAGFSLLRFGKSDPIFLVSEFMCAMKATEPALRRRFVGYFLLALVLLITTIFFQFSGTLLLMDMQPRYVSGRKTAESISVWSQDHSNPVFDVSNVWYTRPLSIVPFAQYKVETLAKFKDGWDTGTTKRGFLPFDSMIARNSINELHGPLPVLDARYECFRPSNFLASLSKQTTGGHTWFNVVGSTVSDTAQGGSVPESWSSRVETNFNCTLPTRSAGIRVEADIPIGLCEANLKPDISSNDLSKAYLVLSVDGSLVEWETYYRSISNSNAAAGIQMLPKDGWMVLSNFEGGNIRLAATMCYTKHSLQLLPDATITRGSSGESQVPPIVWDKVQGRYETNNIRKFFTSPAPSHTLSLGTSAPPTGTGEFNWLSQSLSLEGKMSAVFCISCEYSPNENVKVDNLISTIAQDTLLMEDNPALMLQTFFTILFQEAYTLSIPMFDSSEELLVTRLVARQSPEGCVGYIIVMGMLTFYTVLVGSLMLAFVGWTKNSILGDAWFSVGQIVCRQETEEVVKLAAGWTDKELRDHLNGPSRT